MHRIERRNELDSSYPRPQFQLSFETPLKLHLHYHAQRRESELINLLHQIPNYSNFKLIFVVNILLKAVFHVFSTICTPFLKQLICLLLNFILIRRKLSLLHSNFGKGQLSADLFSVV